MTDIDSLRDSLRPARSLAHIAFVRRDLRRIFDYRRDAVAALLDSNITQSPHS